MDEIDSIVDWQMSNEPAEAGWQCPHCEMNWTVQPSICPCRERGNADMLEQAFWQAILRCAVPEGGSLKLIPCDGTELEATGINFGPKMPVGFWTHMADALADLRASAGMPLSLT